MSGRDATHIHFRVSGDQFHNPWEIRKSILYSTVLRECEAIWTFRLIFSCANFLHIVSCNISVTRHTIFSGMTKMGM